MDQERPSKSNLRKGQSRSNPATQSHGSAFAKASADGRAAEEMSRKQFGRSSSVFKMGAFLCAERSSIFNPEGLKNKKTHS
jgi:hypothetical protein